MALSARFLSANQKSTVNTSFEKHLTYSARNDPVSRNLGFPALAWHAAAMRCRRWRHPESFVLVALFVFLSLGDWRSTLIPTLAVPLSLIRTFFFMLLFGLSINLITLFTLVLAIGVVVDDAILVVEAVHAKMHEKHLSPYRATMEVVHEISGAILAITLVMTAVFIPVTFMTGPVSTFYRQFGLTMATSIVL